MVAAYGPTSQCYSAHFSTSAHVSAQRRTNKKTLVRWLVRLARGRFFVASAFLEGLPQCLHPRLAIALSTAQHSFGRFACH